MRQNQLQKGGSRVFEDYQKAMKERIKRAGGGAQADSGEAKAGGRKTGLPVMVKTESSGDLSTTTSKERGGPMVTLYALRQKANLIFKIVPLGQTSTLLGNPSQPFPSLESGSLLRGAAKKQLDAGRQQRAVELSCGAAG